MNTVIFQGNTVVLLLTGILAVIGVLAISRVARSRHNSIDRHSQDVKLASDRCVALEEELQNSAHRFRDLIESINEAAFEIDEDGAVTYISPVVSQMLGYEVNDLIGNPFTSHIHPDDLEEALCGFTGSLNGESTTVDFRAIKANGEIRWVRSTGRRFFVNQVPRGVRGVFFDIHEQKLSEQALKRSEQITRVIASAARDAVILIDANGIVTYWNPAAESLFGYTVSEAIGQQIHNLIAPNEHRAAAHHGLRVFNGSGSGEAMNKTIELEACHKNGSKFPVELSLASTLLDGCYCAVGIVRDLSDRNKGIESLRKLHLAVERSGEVIFMTDQSGIITFVNPAFTALYGYTSEEVIGKANPRLLKSDKSDSAIYTSLWDTLKAKQVFRGTIVNKAKNGELLTIDTCVSPIVNANGVLEGYLAVQRDVTSQKLHERALSESESRFRTVVESMNEGLIIGSLDRTIIFLNQRLASMCGYSVEELLGKPSELLFAPMERAGFKRRILNRKPDEYDKYETTLATKTGALVPVEISAGPFITPDGTTVGAFAVIKDITNQVRAAQELQVLERQLRQAQKMEAIGTLAGGIAHDFNNILTPIMAYTEIVLASNSDDRVLTNDLNKVMQAAMRAKDLVKQILMFSRQTEVEQHPLSPGPIVKEALKLLRASLPSTIQVNVSVESTQYIIADPTHIHQIVMNLATNAAWAIGENNGNIDVSLSDVTVESGQTNATNSLQSGKYVKLTVRDTGCGISPDSLQRIFEPFYTTKGVGEGTGLGLPVVHGIVKQCGGEIFVSSKLGVGTQFDLYFPTADDEQSSFPISHDRDFSGDERILFVDDEPDIAESCARVLKGYGYQVTPRTSSIEALELFKSKPGYFDILITDYTMPHLTGLQLAHKLRQLEPSLAVIMMTGYSANLKSCQLAEIGISAVVLKPIVGRELAADIRSALDSRKLGNESLQ